MKFELVITGFTNHYGSDVSHPLCERDGTHLKVGQANVATLDRSKVNCPGCIEWMHA